MRGVRVILSLICFTCLTNCQVVKGDGCLALVIGSDLKKSWLPK